MEREARDRAAQLGDLPGEGGGVRPNAIPHDARSPIRTGSTRHRGPSPFGRGALIARTARSVVRTAQAVPSAATRGSANTAAAVHPIRTGLRPALGPAAPRRSARTGLRAAEDSPGRAPRPARRLFRVVADPLDDPRGEEARDHAEQRDAEEHEACGDDPPSGGDRGDVPVADGGDCDQRPPQGAADIGDEGAGRVAFRLEDRERPHPHEQDGQPARVQDEAPPEGGLRAALEDAERREYPHEAQRPQRGQHHGGEVEHVVAQPVPSAGRGGQSDGEVHGEERPAAVEDRLVAALLPGVGEDLGGVDG